MSVISPRTLAKEFHDAYERLAPDFGYVTRPETREFDESSPNGCLMTAVCEAVMWPHLKRLVADISDGANENERLKRLHTDAFHEAERWKEREAEARELAASYKEDYEESCRGLKLACAHAAAQTVYAVALRDKANALIVAAKMLRVEAKGYIRQTDSWGQQVLKVTEWIEREEPEFNDQTGSAKAAGAPGAESTAAPTNERHETNRDAFQEWTGTPEGSYALTVAARCDTYTEATQALGAAFRAGLRHQSCTQPMREAQERIQRDMATKGTARVQDVLTILGDPSKSVTNVPDDAVRRVDAAFERACRDVLLDEINAAIGAINAGHYERAAEILRETRPLCVHQVCNHADLIKAVRALVFAARTSGGVAGRDEALCAVLDVVESLLPPMAGIDAGADSRTVANSNAPDPDGDRLGPHILREDFKGDYYVDDDGKPGL